MRGKCCVLVALFALLSCESDSYDKGEGAYSLTQADFVEAHSNSAKAIDRVVTDDGDVYSVTPQPTANWISTADSTYRAVLYYNKVEGNSVEPVAISQVPVLNVFQSEEVDTVKTDPVTFESVWTSKSGKYLNLGLYLKIGQSDDDKARQTIGMVFDELHVNDDGTCTAYLRLYHDQGSVPEYYSSKYYVSILRSSIKADSVCLNINTYDGVVSYRIGLPSD